MIRVMRCVTAAMFAAALAIAQSAAVAESRRPAVSAPVLSQTDLALLFATARDAVAQGARGESARAPSYVPLKLRDLRAALRLALRQRGRLLCEMQTPVGALVAVTSEGGAALGAELKRRDASLTARTAELALELEVLGDDEAVAVGLTPEGYWSPELYAEFHAGLHGVDVALGEKRGRVTPGFILASNYSPDLALQTAERRANITIAEKKARPDAVKYFRFLTVFAWQRDADAAPVRLERGVVRVEADAVTAERLDAAVTALLSYVRYRQNRDGAFAYCYQPSTDRYDERNSATAQLGMLAAWLSASRLLGDSTVVDRAEPLLRGAIGSLKPLPESADAKYVSFEGHEDKLGSTAMLLQALLEVRSDTERDAARRALGAALRAAQLDDGRLGVKDVGGAAEFGTADYAAGAALLALARDGANAEDPRFVEVLRRARAFYGPHLRTSTDTAAVALHARALACAYARRNDAELSDQAFALLDRLRGSQVAPAMDASGLLVGAIDLAGGSRVGITTAPAAAALADGLALARRVGDSARTATYEAALRSAVRFVLQLGYREEECFYVRSLRDVIGAYRSALWENSVPIQNCEQALTALSRARQVLFGDTPRAASRPSQATVKQ